MKWGGRMKLTVLLLVAISTPAVADGLVDQGIGPGVLTLGQGGGDAVSELTLTKVGGMTTTYGTQSYTAEGMVIGGDVGLTDRLQIGASYGVILRNDLGTVFDGDNWKGTVTGRVAYLAVARPDLRIAATGAVIDFLDIGQRAYELGAAVQVPLAPNLALFTPGDQLRIGANDKVGLELPVGLAMQMTPSLYAFGQVDLADISLANGSDAYVIADFLPITAGAFVTPARGVDLGFELMDNLEQARSYTAFALARLRSL